MTRTVTAFLRKLEFKIEDKDLRIACYPLLSLRFHYACATMMSEGAEAATSNTGSSPSIWARNYKMVKSVCIYLIMNFDQHCHCAFPLVFTHHA